MASILRSLYGSRLLRILVSLLAVLWLAYYTLLLPWLNRALSENYQQQTGHQLQYDTLDLQLFSCNLHLRKLQDSAQLWRAEAIHLNIGCWQSLRQRTLVINEIAIVKLVVNAHQLADGHWSFDDVQKHIAAVGNKKSGGQAADASLPVVIKKLTLADASIHSNILALNNMPLAVAPLDIAIDTIDLRKPQPVKLLLNAKLNQAVALKVSGQLDLFALTGQLDMNLQHLPLLWFDNLIKTYAAVDVLDGTIEGQHQLSLIKGVPQRLITRGKLTDLKLRPTHLQQDAVKWKSLEWENGEIFFNDKVIRLPLLMLNELDGQFIIDKDRTTNLQAMLIEPALPANVGEPATEPSPAPWQFEVARLALNNAAIGFYDQSLIPSFSVIVQQFSGDIRDISSDPAQTAKIHLAGNVDGYAPVNLDGSAKFFIDQPQLEALFSIKQLDMGALSPYSAEYAGWRIKKGLLSVNLDYHYDHGKIIGKNHVVMDHLKFGEKVRSTQMTDIPLRLALSLLTDQNGVAVLDAEIAGDPSDPSFNIRETLWRALRNTLKKIVTAPFQLLSRLVNSKEDLGRIQFTYGESQLTEQAIVKLKLLQEALDKRPGMRLNIEGRYDEQADLLALQQEQVNSALQHKGLPLDAIKTKNAAWVSAVNAAYASRGLTHLEATAEQKNQELAALEEVDPERFNRLAHERAQAVKQYFVIQLGGSSDKLFLDSETRCDIGNRCTSSEVVFTLED